MNKICIIGMGNMGRAIKTALEPKFEIRGCDKNDNSAFCVDLCDIVFLAIKPQDFHSLSGKFEVGSKLIVSIMAGISISEICSSLNCERVVRVMPNLPLKVGAAVSGWISRGVEDKSEIREILQMFGTEIELPDESKIDAITALSGSGPAYYYWMNKVLIAKAVSMGFKREEACKIIMGTFLGAAKLLESCGGCACDMINQIASKGGTTEAALDRLDAEMINNAVDCAYLRSKALNDEST